MNNDEVYSPDGVPAGQIIRRPVASDSPSSGRSVVSVETVSPTVSTPDQASSVNAEAGFAQTETLGGDQLRERLRLALRRHIDPDDDTMPALCRGDEFIWVGTDSVIDDLIKAIAPDELPAALALHRVQELANTHSSELPDALDVGGEYETGWDSAMDAIKAAINNRPASGPQHPITSHPYQGDGFLHPCTAVGFGSMCGSTQWDHMEEQ